MIQSEVEELLDQHVDRRTADGRAGVVRNGHHPERSLQTGLGPVQVRIPKVRAKVGDSVTFRSSLVPPYVRKTRSLEAALPWLYLKGISTGEMSEALEALVGPRRPRVVGDHGVASETSMVRGIHDMATDVAGRSHLGVRLGRWRLQPSPRRIRQTLRAGGVRRQ